MRHIYVAEQMILRYKQIMATEREGIGNVHTMDYLRIARRLHSGAEKILDEELGKGLRFAVQGHEKPARLDIYPRNSAVIFQTETVKLELKDVARPNFTPEGIIFQNRNIGEERYLMISGDGEVVFLLGQSTGQLLGEVNGIPSPVVPPKTYPPRTSAALPEYTR